MSEITKLPLGFPTHTQDIDGNTICLGDVVTYDFDDGDQSCFEVVFEENAFRKKFDDWEDDLEKPILENTLEAKYMNLKILRKFIENSPS